MPIRSMSARKCAGEIVIERIAFPAILCVLAFALFGCSPPKGEFVGAQDGGGSAAPNYSGYVLLANTATRSVSIYDSSFTESTARVLKIYPTANTPSSLARYDGENVLVTVDGTPDRVDKINLRTGEVLTGYIMDSTNLTGAIKGISRLSGGDIVVSDNSTGAHLERFSVGSSSFVRYTVGWPATLLNTTQRIFPLQGDSFLACAGGTSDVVRMYSNVAAQLASASATAPAPSLGAAHDVTGCVADSAGRIAVTFNGATDTVRLFSSNLSTTVWSFSDAARLPNPVSLGVRSNGNFLAVDASNQVLEISGTDGTLVTSFTPQLAATVSQILVMP